MELEPETRTLLEQLDEATRHPKLGGLGYHTDLLDQVRLAIGDAGRVEFPDSRLPLPPTFRLSPAREEALRARLRDLLAEAQAQQEQRRPRWRRLLGR